MGCTERFGPAAREALPRGHTRCLLPAVSPVPSSTAWKPYSPRACGGILMARRSPTTAQPDTRLAPLVSLGIPYTRRPLIGASSVGPKDTFLANRTSTPPASKRQRKDVQ